MVAQLLLSIITVTILMFFLGLISPWFRYNLVVLFGVMFVSLLHGLTLIIAGLDIIIVFLLIWYGFSYAAVALLLMLTVAQTMRYYNKDIFAGSDDVEFIGNTIIQGHLDDEQWLYHTLLEDALFEESVPMVSRNGAYVLFSQPHVCICQPCIMYSPDGAYRALIYHKRWRSYFLFAREEYFVRYEKIEM